jgi:hypothetical protein
MNNMLITITPKSDQANFDDFVGGVTKNIKVTKVTLAMSEQPVSIHYEGDNGKPYKPGKSMRRVLVHCWGADANLYVGRSMTLYGDPSVVFAGQKVGGIRISHLSDIKEPVTMALTAAKAVRKPFTVNPLMEPASAGDLDVWLDDIAKCPDEKHLKLKFDASLKVFSDDKSRRKLIDAKDAAKARLTTTSGNKGDDTNANT